MLRLTGGKDERARKEAGAQYFLMPPAGDFPHEVSNNFIEAMKGNLTSVGWEAVGDHIKAYFGLKAIDVPIHACVGINTKTLLEGERYEFVRYGERPIHFGAIPVEVDESDPSYVKLRKLGVYITKGGERYDSYGLPWSFDVTPDVNFPGTWQLIIHTGDNNLFITVFSVLGSFAPIGGGDPSLDPGVAAYSIGGGWVLKSQNYVSPPVILRFRTSNLDATMDIDMPASDIEGYWNGKFGAGFNWNGVFPYGIYGYAMVCNKFQFILFAPGCVEDHSFMIASSMHPESQNGMMYISGPTFTGGGTRKSGLGSIHGGGGGNWYYETKDGFRMGPTIGVFDPEFAMCTNAGGPTLSDSVHNDIIDSLMITPGVKASFTEPFINAYDARKRYSIQGSFWDCALINFSQDPITTNLGAQTPNGFTGMSQEEIDAILARNATMWQIYPKDEISMEGELSAGRGIIIFGQPGSMIYTKGMFVAFTK